MSNDFHDLFKQSVPEAPSTQGWVQGARRKRRKRRVVAGGVAALAVLGLAVPLALDLPGRSEPIVASPEPMVTPTATESPTPSESPEPSVEPSSGQATEASGPEVELFPSPDGRPGAAACWNEAGEPVMEWHNSGTIEAGAARAWLCPNPQHYGTAGPLEPLVTDVDGLIEAFYAQPEVTSEDAQSLAEWYTVVFEYPDGSKRSFSGDIQDSTAMTDGEVRLQGSEAFYRDEVAARWLAQRAEIGAPAGAAQLPQECPVTVNQSLLQVPLGEITSGYACALDQGEPTANVQIPAALAAAVGAEALADGVSAEAVDDGSLQDHRLVLRDVWGDEIVLSKRSDRYEFRGDSSLMAWTPSQEFAAELDALFGR